MTQAIISSFPASFTLIFVRMPSRPLLQTVVNEKPLLPDAEIRNNIVLPAHESIAWLSPRAEDGYAEYRDQTSFRVWHVINWASLGNIWIDGVVPLTMKRVFHQINCLKFLICYFDPSGVAVWVDPAFNLKSSFGCCCRDQIDNFFMANEWLPPPILTNKRKQAMLDFVTFTGPGWKMANRNRQSRFVTEFLHFYFPQPYSGRGNWRGSNGNRPVR